MNKPETIIKKHQRLEQEFKASPELELIQARRTAFISRFIVLREGKRSRAHRQIEMMQWSDWCTAEELAALFRQAFIDNHDNLEPVDRDLRRALGHASRSIEHFIAEYAKRATKNFIDALIDYDYSNQILFGGEDQPKMVGWRLPHELKADKAKSES